VGRLAALRWAGVSAERDELRRFVEDLPEVEVPAARELGALTGWLTAA
jgi:hypothetical protein